MIATALAIQHAMASIPYNQLVHLTQAKQQENDCGLLAMNRKRRITIKDVAQECGLAFSTVSNALANKSIVTPETRQRVFEVAERLGYRASGLARGLRTNRTFAIGVLVADVANPSVADHLRGIDDVAIRENCNVILCNTDGIELNQIRLMQALGDRHVDGMILISQHCQSSETRRLMADMPFVLMHRRCADFEDPYIGTDNVQAIDAAIRHLVELGHRRIAMFHGPLESSTAQERIAAFRHCVQVYGLDSDETLIQGGEYSSELGYQLAGQQLDTRSAPTAILASNDVNALGVLEAAFERKLSVPADLSVIGTDDVTFAKFSRIDLTTLRPPRRKMGSDAAELLMQMIHGDPQGETTRIFPTELIVRGSTAPPAPRLPRRPARPARADGADHLAITRRKRA
jgi:LacI family transcriptional regulator